MNNNSKTCHVITWADGSQELVHRSNGFYIWGSTFNSSSTLWNLTHIVEGLGGVIKREPNPHYVAKTPANPFAKFF